MFGARAQHGDLPAVLMACRERLGFDGSCSRRPCLGGTPAALLRAMAGRAGSPAGRRRGAVVVARIFTREHAPWSATARRGRPFIDAIDRDRDRA
jgi:hypothetical protein